MPIAPQIETSFFVIFSPAQAHYPRIVEMLSRHQLHVKRVRLVHLTNDHLEVIEPEAKPESELARLIASSICRCAFVGEVEGPDAIQELRRLSGSDPRPHQCPRHSIRALFGARSAIHFRKTHGDTIWFPHGFAFARDNRHAKEMSKLMQ